MESVASLSSWAFSPAAWFTLAIALIIADLVIGMEFFVLSVGVAALLVSGIIWTQNQGVFELFENWRQVALCFGLLSLFSIALIKWAFQGSGDDHPDINEY